MITVDDAAVVPGDCFHLKISSNQNWCGASYQNPSNGVYNSYCGPIDIIYCVCEDPKWEVGCHINGILDVIKNDLRLNRFVTVECEGSDIILSSYECGVDFEIVEGSTNAGFVNTIVETNPGSTDYDIPYGYVVAMPEGDVCNNVILPESETDMAVGITFNCQEIYGELTACGPRYFYCRGEEVKVLKSGKLWVPYSSDKPEIDYNDLIYYLYDGMNGRIVTAGRTDPAPPNSVLLPNSKILDKCINITKRIILIDFQL